MSQGDAPGRSPSAARVFLAGGVLLLLGLTVAVGWLAHEPWLTRLLPGFDGMPYSTALGFMLAGLALLEAAARSRTSRLPGAVAAVLPGLLILLGLLALAELFWGLHLGLTPDPEATRAWFPDSNAHPGQMRPLAAMAFIVIGLATGLAVWTRDSRASMVAQGLALLVMLAGFAGLVGETADLRRSFSWYLGTVFFTGLGFLAAGYGLLALLRQRTLLRANWGGDDADRIRLVAGAIVLGTGLAGILGGFAILYPQAVGGLESNLALSLKSRSDVLEDAIQQAWLDSQAFANQPLRVEAMGRLDADPGDSGRRREIDKVARRYRDFGFSGVVFRDAHGREVARAGAFISAPEMTVSLRAPVTAELLWERGYVLHTHAAMLRDGVVVGSLEAERRLPVGEGLQDSTHFGSSLDFVVCARAGAEAVDCFPFRSAGEKVLRKLPWRFQGEPIPMAHALSGETGIVYTRDYRGVRVIAAHRPLGTLGLGAVLKIDADQLYSPIAGRLKPLLILVLLLSAGAVALLRLQVTPMTRRLAEEIEERKKAERDAERARAEMAEIASTLGEGVYVLDAEGRVTFVNPEAERLLGWTAAEIVGRDGHDTVHCRRPDGSLVPRDQCPTHQAILGGQTYRSLNDWFVHKDGHLVPVSIVSSPILRDGKVRGAVASFSDISQRLAHEAALRESEARFRTVLENAPIGTGMTGRDGRFVEANPTLCSLLGYSREELLGLGLDAVSHPDDRAASAALMARALAGEFDTYKVEKRYLRKDGSVILAQVTVSIVRDADGKPEYIIGQVEDISERRKHEEALRESEERFRLISTVATDGIITMDPEARITYWNPAAAKIFGYGEAEVVGQPLHELLAPSRFLEGFRRGFEKFLETGGGAVIGKTVEIAAIRRNGEEFPVELSVSALRIKDRWHALGVVRDISERKRTEDQIRHLAYYDFLTDLPNRRLFIDRLNQGLVQARRYHRSLAVLYLDLDRFKSINDSLGHDVGDALLVAVAARLRDCVRSSDTVARLGGDEFAVVLGEVAQVDDAALVAEKIIASLRNAIGIKEHVLRISTSIGIAIYPVDGGEDAQALIKKADMALYEAKGAGRDRYAFAAAAETA